MLSPHPKVLKSDNIALGKRTVAFTFRSQTNSNVVKNTCFWCRMLTNVDKSLRFFADFAVLRNLSTLAREHYPRTISKKAIRRAAIRIVDTSTIAII